MPGDLNSSPASTTTSTLLRRSSSAWCTLSLRVLQPLLRVEFHLWFLSRLCQGRAIRPILGARSLDVNSGQGHDDDLFRRGLAPHDPSVPASNRGTGMKMVRQIDESNFLCLMATIHRCGRRLQSSISLCFQSMSRIGSRWPF
jgi:hypothetical protein